MKIFTPVDVGDMVTLYLMWSGSCLICWTASSLRGHVLYYWDRNYFLKGGMNMEVLLAASSSC